MFQALIIAFSSDFLEKILYYFEKKTVVGFKKANLLYSKYNATNVILKECRYFESKHIIFIV